MKWEPNIMNMNAQGMQDATLFGSSLQASTVSVTLSDPYMTGASWAVLFDSAAAYTASNLAAASGILLPACKEGESPISGNCRRARELEVEDPNIRASFLGSYAHLLVQFYYDVAGTRFGLDTYFRVQGFNIMHGKSYPQVQIRGVEPQIAVFNQSLGNYQMVENETLEQNLERIAKSFNTKVSFCTPPGADYGTEYIMPVSFKEKFVTGGEVIKKYLRSVKGSFTSLPLKEYANKISICTRGNVNQGCSVFYLGVGLYEGYTISGGVEKDTLSLNAQGQQIERSLGYQFEPFEPVDKEYVLEDLLPVKRKAKLEKVKKVPFPEQFTESDKKFAETQTFSGFIWKGPGPKVTNTKVRKTNLFGIGVNGDKPISFLDGVVVGAVRTAGYVRVQTNYFMSICDSTKKCVTRPIFQETGNLSSVSVGIGQKLSVGEEIGTATKDKKEFVRFYIPNSVSLDGSITLDPELVWNFAQPIEGLTDEEKKKAKIYPPDAQRSASGYLPAPPSRNVVTPAPKAGPKNWQTTAPGERASKILVMAGHADLVSSGPEEVEFNKQLLEWAKRNAANYGIQNILEYYSPPSTNIPADSPNSQFTKTQQAVNQGKQVIEIHLDEPNGSRGVIPPYSGKKIWPLDDILAESYGSFPRNFRTDLGVPRRGGTILEVGRQDAATTNIFKNGTSDQKEALYKQLMDPFMRAVAAQYSIPAPRNNPSAPAQSGCFGKMGSTGLSTGPHLHVEWDSPPNKKRTEIFWQDVAKYVTLGGTNITGTTSPWSRNRCGVLGPCRPHRGVDISNGNDKLDIGLKNGAFLKTIVESKCKDVNDASCGDGYGNSIIIGTPDGDMFIGHLKEGSLNCARPGTSSNGYDADVGSKSASGVQTAPSPVGVTIETEFNGIPRALRIIPGRTVLSFITKYDEWIENGRTKDIDPGVWIAGRFSKWFVQEVNYTWTQGNLRVKLTGVSDWGAQTAKVQSPKWEDYLKSEGFEKTKDYFGYIRSLGELCWQLGDGKTSCEVLCEEAEALREFLKKPGSSNDPEAPKLPPSSVTTNFPPAQCQYKGTKYPKDRVNAIINAARVGGINTKAGYAGVVGNAIIESRQGEELNPRATNFKGCIGIFQWCDRRAGLENFARSQNKSALDFGVQMQWFIRELQGADYSGPKTIRLLNSSSSPEQAAFSFCTEFERALVDGVPNTCQKGTDRQIAAREIFNDLDCR